MAAPKVSVKEEAKVKHTFTRLTQNIKTLPKEFKL